MVFLSGQRNNAKPGLVLRFSVAKADGLARLRGCNPTEGRGKYIGTPPNLTYSRTCVTSSPQLTNNDFCTSIVLIVVALFCFRVVKGHIRNACR